MKPIVIFGAGGHAKVVIDIIEKSGEYQIVGLIDQRKTAGTLLYGYEILGDHSVLAQLKGSLFGGIVAVGDNWTRSRMVSSIYSVDEKFTFVTAIHPSAEIAKGTMIGEGTVVMAGVVVGSDTRIGKHCILNTWASVDHDCSMGDYSSLAPRATTGGNVRVGSFSAISLGANVVHSINIGEHTVIGAGATVLSAIDPYVVAYGVPAKVIKKRNVGEGYL